MSQSDETVSKGAMSDQAERLRTSRDEIAVRLGERLKVNESADVLLDRDSPFNRIWEALIDSEAERDALQKRVRELEAERERYYNENQAGNKVIQVLEARIGETARERRNDR